MSYPDLGCFAECLQCEVCDENWFSPQDVDLFPDDLDLGDDLGLDDWAPEAPDDSGFDFPTGLDFGPFEISPTFNPIGVEISGEF